jgi:hypothetical protein
MQLSQHCVSTENTVFSLATKAGQEEQQQSRTILWKAAALIGKGNYLRQQIRLHPPWRQDSKHRRQLAGVTSIGRGQKDSLPINAHASVGTGLPLPLTATAG